MRGSALNSFYNRNQFPMFKRAKEIQKAEMASATPFMEMSTLCNDFLIYIALSRAHPRAKATLHAKCRKCFLCARKKSKSLIFRA